MSDRPLRLEIRTPGAGAPAALIVEDGASALVGRGPTPATVPGAEAAIPLSVTSPNVSSNHVWVRARGDQASVVDLGSRNGTWLRLPPHAEVTLPIPATPLALRLAPSDDVPVAAAAWAEPGWTSAADYGEKLTTSIERWLAASDLPARVSILDGALALPDGVGRIPLATGRDLLVEPIHTVGGSWLTALAEVERFVARQNVLFETEQTMREEGLIVASPALRRAVAQVIEIAASGARVLLLTGASGTGKEGLARCFHRHTQRPGPFVARNCAMFSKELVRSELFGAEKGAFTGSVQRLVGAVETANEGTLFLDELGELPREVQPMLLRFLDHGEYERLGRGGVPSVADVRIVCATNRDLRAATQSDAFRTDLWFRLSVHVVEVPPLRQRGEDLVAYLTSRARGDGGSLYDALTPEARALLADHDWPGNFRELVSFAERLLRAVPRGPIATEAARAALAEGALRPLQAARLPASPAASASVVQHAARALAAFEEDREAGAPRSWDEVKDFVENYLKPVLFAELSGNAAADAQGTLDLRAAAEQLGSDRGTAAKQLRRYRDRFGA